GDQSRLVELNPFDTGGGQDADDVEVDIGELREPVEGTRGRARCGVGQGEQGQRSHEHGTDRKSTRLNSSHVSTSYAVFCLKKQNLTHARTRTEQTHLARTCA